MQVLPSADAKAGLSELVTQVEKQHDQATVARSGAAAAVVIPVDEWESLRETIAVLSDPETVRAIAEAQDDVERGDVYTTEEILDARADRRHGT